MAGLITMGLGPNQLLLTMGLGTTDIILPPVVVRRVGGRSKPYSVKKRIRDEEENKFLENWIIEVSSVDIYSKVEKEIDMKPNITVIVKGQEIKLSKDSENIQVEIERVRVNSE